eukprot:gnl/TRDRNA2_/TRDRNA2_157073_c0_seq1.p1 gnl/TRDRNA2_/TRDRNA2_157073_c0~~gnl/TRDRNA2_/TRDRNA2_157073_c0_seq1.p1  ORF type:complete len:429 (+),score=58.26 gnl/TRDRNA2_/TRDRNA2_157073_c0_seq1:110-1396(+)
MGGIGRGARQPYAPRALHDQSQLADAVLSIRSSFKALEFSNQKLERSVAKTRTRLISHILGARCKQESAELKDKLGRSLTNRAVKKVIAARRQHAAAARGGTYETAVHAAEEPVSDDGGSSDYDSGSDVLGGEELATPDSSLSPHSSPRMPAQTLRQSHSPPDVQSPLGGESPVLDSRSFLLTLASASPTPPNGQAQTGVAADDISRETSTKSKRSFGVTTPNGKPAVWPESPSGQTFPGPSGGSPLPHAAPSWRPETAGQRTPRAATPAEPSRPATPRVTMSVAANRPFSAPRMQRHAGQHCQGERMLQRPSTATRVPSGGQAGLHGSAGRSPMRPASAFGNLQRPGGTRPPSSRLPIAPLCEPQARCMAVAGVEGGIAGTLEGVAAVGGDVAAQRPRRTTANRMRGSGPAAAGAGRWGGGMTAGTS